MATTSDFKQALQHLSQVPGPMAALIDKHGPPTLARTRNSFQSLGRAIVYQQLSGKAASTIYQRFVALFPGRRFPRPDLLLATPIETLRGVGLSRGKSVSLLDLAQKYVDGTVTPRRFNHLSDEALMAMLTAVKGVGPWSVHMFMMFGLVRPNVLPVGDLGVRKGVQVYFSLADLPTPAVMEAVTDAWRPFRTAGCWYMWRLLEHGLPAGASAISS